MPFLPQDDPDPEARRRTLARAKEDYRYLWDNRLLFAEIPPQERFPWHYMAVAAKVIGWAALNHAVGSLRHRVAKRLKPGRSKTDAYRRIFTLVPEPPSARYWEHDWCFAWQRLLGHAPQLLQGIDEIPDHFAVTGAHFDRVANGAQSLEAALAEGRLFLLDHRLLDGIEPTVHDGRTKHVSAPLTLFWSSPDGQFRPVAIQTAQQPDGRIFTPRDGVGWQVARHVVQCSDSLYSGVVAHLGLCHMIAARLVMAARRELSERHPLMVLLAPHFEFTLMVNDVARMQLTRPGGKMERFQGGTRPAQLDALEAGIREVRYAHLSAVGEHAHRKVDRFDTLPDYPFRDDGLLCWQALRRYVGDYVALYYPDATSVKEDRELHAMIEEIRSDTGGRLANLVEGCVVETPEDVAQLVASILYRVTTYHASINYSGWDWLAWPHNMSLAAWGPVPTGSVSEKDLLQILPDLDMAWEAHEQEFQVSGIKVNQLGEYPEGSFEDPRVAPLVAEYQRELRQVEEQIVERNRSRPLPYTYLLPSKQTNSINS